VRVPCKAAHAHVCMHTLRVACLPVLYVGSSRVTTGWRVILSASGWADLTSRVWRTQLRCDPKPRLWPGGFGTFRKRTDMSGDALGTRSLSTPLPMVAEPAQNRATDPYFVLPSSDKRMKGRAISNWSPRSEPAQAKRWEAEVREAMRTSTPSIPLIVLEALAARDHRDDRISRCGLFWRAPVSWPDPLHA
jgi:hypothetical protein